MVIHDGEDMKQQSSQLKPGDKFTYAPFGDVVFTVLGFSPWGCLRVRGSDTNVEQVLTGEDTVELIQRVK